MLCPVCNIDFEDSVAKVDNKKKVVGFKDHYQQPFRLIGISCPGCGHVSEFIQIPTGNLFHQSKQKYDPSLFFAFYKYITILKNEERYDEYSDFTKMLRSHLE